jgi:hypothetical protein
MADANCVAVELEGFGDAIRHVFREDFGHEASDELC